MTDHSLMLRGAREGPTGIGVDKCLAVFRSLFVALLLGPRL